jgi:hypothetical protein
MILSSADILRILGGSEIIRLSAKIKVVDGKPALSGAEGLSISVERFPKIDEFEATWTLYVESDGSEPDDLVLAEIRRLLPSVTISEGLLTTVTTTDFLSENTQRAPEAPKAAERQVVSSEYEERFQSLVEDVQDQMLLVGSGRPGKDGLDGRDGVDGKDGRDISATETDLEDLQNVEERIPKQDGQVLTWKDGTWQNLFVRSSRSVSGGGAGTSNGDAVSSTVQWKYRPDPLDNTLADGTFHSDNGNGELVTKIRVSHLTNRNNDITVLIGDLLQQGYDRLYVAQSDDLSQAHLYSITGFAPVTDGTELSVVHVQTAGIEPDFVNNKTYEFYISKSATAGGGGVPEAPIDGNQYARQSGGWTVVQAGGGDVEEAPQDGNYYVRQNGQWINLMDALYAIDDKAIDGGNLETGISTGGDTVVDGGVIT